MTEEALEQLLQSLNLQALTRRGRNWMACCPAHEERRPSWGISVNEPHVFGCFACGFRGTLPKLLALRGWSKVQIADLLQANTVADAKRWRLAVPVETIPTTELYTADYYLPFQLEYLGKRYLWRRGISSRTAERAQVVYSPLTEELLFPWRWRAQFYGVTSRPLKVQPEHTRKAYGELAKRRLLYVPLGDMTSGPDLWLVEGELDALKLVELGCANVAAVGHGTITAGQVAWLQNLPVNFSRVLLAFDHDSTGQRLTQRAATMLPSSSLRFKVWAVDWSKLGSSQTKWDPGALVDRAELQRLEKTARPWSNWHLFSA